MTAMELEYGGPSTPPTRHIENPRKAVAYEKEDAYGTPNIKLSEWNSIWMD
jgi:hypothetical protein